MATRKELTAMRQEIRAKDRTAKFKARTSGVFRHMVERAKELEREAEINFTIEQLRVTLGAHIGQPCMHCGIKLTITNFGVDHWQPVARGGTFGFDNLRFPCKTCNGQKGSLSGFEFEQLRAFLYTLDAVAKGDILRRLGLGARWRS